MKERPKLNFVTYVFMLYQSGLIALGKMENPVTKRISIELEEAKGIIELFELLEEKTRGNLTSEEERTLKMLLDTLRFNFVDEVNKKELENENKDKQNKDGENIEIH